MPASSYDPSKQYKVLLKENHRIEAIGLVLYAGRDDYTVSGELLNQIPAAKVQSAELLVEPSV